MKNAVTVSLLLLVLLPAATSLADDPVESLTNQDVVALTKAGLGEAVIVAKIQEAPRTEFAVDGAGSPPETAGDGKETPRWKLWKRGRNDDG